MYNVAKFIKCKKEDWDNGCAQTEKKDLEALRYERTRTDIANEIRKRSNIK